MIIITISKENDNQYLLNFDNGNKIIDHYLVKIADLNREIVRQATYYENMGHSIKLIHNGVFNLK